MQVFCNAVDDIFWQFKAQFGRFCVDNRYARFKIRRLDVGQQTPFKTCFHAVFECVHFFGRPVGGQYDLSACFIECVKCVEKFFLCALFARDKLNIVNQQQVGHAVFIAEGLYVAFLNGSDQFIGKIFAFDINDAEFGVRAANDVADCVQQVGFSQAGLTIDKEGIVIFGRMIGDRNRGGVREFVG